MAHGWSVSGPSSGHRLLLQLKAFSSAEDAMEKGSHMPVTDDMVCPSGPQEGDPEAGGTGDGTVTTASTPLNAGHGRSRRP